VIARLPIIQRIAGSRRNRSASLSSRSRPAVRTPIDVASRPGEGVRSCRCTPIDESVGTETQGVVQLAIGEQPCIGRDRGAAKLKHHAAIEIELQSAPVGFIRRVSRSCPVLSPMILNSNS